ncbi:nucleotidyltransferase family protein [Sphingomicrobium arenosum]|uniref:nucleotidyltransferase family protein n=1 Tax=Sphingomicrobium arenosum TaxID=2233861 RepID=UPI00224085EF|nr:nucleotidyltransferase family protein [Sphingomicrobium arenosum]
MIALEPWERLGAALLTPSLDVAAPLLAGVEAEGWSRLDERLDAHRCAPLAASRLPPSLRHHVPPAILAAWDHARRAATIDHLHQQKVLADIFALLVAHDLEACALKGAWLSLFAYPEPGLRPLRDLDILMRDREAALEAHALLVKAGFTPLEPVAGDLSAILEERHQLPPLVDPTEQVLVEVHQRMFHDGRADLADDDDFWNRCVTRDLLGSRVTFPASEPLAVHLLAHAMWDHGFDNGPLLVADLALLFDHPDFGRVTYDALVARHGLQAEAELADELVSPPPSEALSPAAAAAWRLMLAPGNEVARLRQRDTLRRAGPAAILAKIFPSVRQLSARGAVRRTPLGILGAYARHFHRLVTRRRQEIGAPVDPALQEARTVIDTACAKNIDLSRPSPGGR